MQWGKMMHVRLAERRDLIQTERWANLARSIQRTSDRVARILGDTQSVAAQRLVTRLLVLQRHLAENEYSGAQLAAAVAMVDDVAATLSQLVVELGVLPRPPSPQAVSTSRSWWATTAHPTATPARSPRRCVSRRA